MVARLGYILDKVLTKNMLNWSTMGGRMTTATFAQMTLERRTIVL